MNTKDTAFREIDMYDGVRAAISQINSDLSQSFHVPYDDLNNETKLAISQNIPAPHTIFDGRKNEMVFTSLSHRVYYASRKECEQTEISYFLQKKQGSNLPSLMKRDSGMIDADLFTGGPVYTILDNVSQLEFSYWDEKQQKWLDDWNSDGNAMKDRFPLAVKLKMTVVGNGNQHLAMETQFKIAYPDNQANLVQF